MPYLRRPYLAGYNDIRGNLLRLHRALEEFEQYPEQLDRERQRFVKSPPSYVSSTTSTLSQVSNPEQLLREQRRMKLVEEREASVAWEQFKFQAGEERKRIWNSESRIDWMPLSVNRFTFQEEAREIIKNRWIEQGIWDNKWNDYPIGRLWKHELPLEVEPESESPKSDEEKQRISERRAVQEREREASRPYHQFVYQVSTERQRILEESTNIDAADAADINTKAYEIVKNTWVKREIWNTKWGILPGMKWKHEEPLEEEAADGVVLAPETALIDIHREASTVVTTPQGQPAAVDLAAFMTREAENLPTAPSSPYPQTIEWVLSPTKRQVLRLGRREKAQKDGQPPSMPSTPLGPVHPSKVSKAAKRTKPGRPPRLHISPEVASSRMPLSLNADATEPQLSPSPESVIPRRSKRLQSHVSSAAKELAKTVSLGRSKRAVRSTKSSAKPHGVFKKRSSKTTQEKARRSGTIA